MCKVRDYYNICTIFNQAREDEINVGEEMAGPLRKDDILRVLNRFYSNEDIKDLARENGLDSMISDLALFCCQAEKRSSTVLI